MARGLYILVQVGVCRIEWATYAGGAGPMMYLPAVDGTCPPEIFALDFNPFKVSPQYFLLCPGVSIYLWGLLDVKAG